MGNKGSVEPHSSPSPAEVNTLLLSCLLKPTVALAARSSYCVNQNIFVFQKTFLEVGKGSVSAFIVIKTGTFCLAIVFIVLVRLTKASY